MQYFAERINERTGGKWQQKLFASVSLGNDVTMVSNLQSGKLYFSEPDTSTLNKFERGFSLLNLPFEFDSDVEATRILDGKFGSELATSLEAHRLVGLGYWENGFRHVTNSKRPLRGESDFEKLNIRVMKNRFLSMPCNLWARKRRRYHSRNWLLLLKIEMWIPRKIQRSPF